MSDSKSRDLGNVFESTAIPLEKDIKQPLPPIEQVPWMRRLLAQSQATQTDGEGRAGCRITANGQERTGK